MPNTNGQFYDGEENDKGGVIMNLFETGGVRCFFWYAAIFHCDKTFFAYVKKYLDYYLQNY